MRKSPIIAPTASFPEVSNHEALEKLDQTVVVKAYGKLKIRAIRAEDEKQMVHFHERISEESIYMRYFEYLGLDQRVSHERLVKICKNSADSYAIVVVELEGTSRYPAAIVAVGRLTTTSEPEVVSFDTLIADQENAPELGKVLLHQLVKLAHAFGFRILTSDLMVSDHDSLNLSRTLGFTLQTVPKEKVVRVTLAL
jgi:acetyltransferase